MSLNYVMIGSNDVVRSRAYVRDPDGNKMSFVYFSPTTES